VVVVSSVYRFATLRLGVRD